MLADFHPHAICKYCPKCGSKGFKPHSPKSQKCDVCGFVFFTNAAAAVAAIITNTQGEILLTTRAFDPGKGLLDLPGGFVDPGESIEQALHREIYEELNLHISSSTYIGSFPNEYVYGGILYYTIDLVFECDINDISTIRVADDVSAYGFYKPTQELIEQVGLPSIKKILAHYTMSDTK